MARLDYVLEPGGRIAGSARVPGDKSISHRAVLLGGISDGTTRISGFLEGEDTLATLAAFQAMGVTAVRNGSDVVIEGRGLHGLRAPHEVLDLGNSGTAMRLMVGLLAGQRYESHLTGDASLRTRPMGRVINPLRDMGADVEATEGLTAPLTIRPASDGGLRGIDYEMPVASAQVKSCLLLAGLYAQGTTTVFEPETTRDHTERMLRGFGYEVEHGGGRASLTGGGTLRGQALTVPADLSSAAFFIVAASIARDSSLRLEGVGLNPTRDGVLRVLEQMGAKIGIENRRDAGGEPIGDLTVETSELQGIEIPPALVPLAIDEFPILMVAAAAAKGTTIVRGAAELRVKESDRIAAMADGLTRLGVSCETFDDGMVVHGGGLRGGSVSSFTDHRIAMAFAVSSLAASEQVIVEDCANVATSFPGFENLARQLGLRLETRTG